MSLSAALRERALTLHALVSSELASQAERRHHAARRPAMGWPRAAETRKLPFSAFSARSSAGALSPASDGWASGAHAPIEKALDALSTHSSAAALAHLAQLLLDGAPNKVLRSILNNILWSDHSHYHTRPIVSPPGTLPTASILCPPVSPASARAHVRGGGGDGGRPAGGSRRSARNVEGGADACEPRGAYACPRAPRDAPAKGIYPKDFPTSPPPIYHPHLPPPITPPHLPPPSNPPRLLPPTTPPQPPRLYPTAPLPLQVAAARVPSLEPFAPSVIVALCGALEEGGGRPGGGVSTPSTASNSHAVSKVPASKAPAELAAEALRGLCRGAAGVRLCREAGLEGTLQRLPDRCRQV